MGIIKDTKVNAISREAQKAFEAGHYFFTPFLNTPASQPGMSGNIEDWALMIQGVESSGWALTHWSVAMDTKGRAQAYPLFRRRG